MTQPRTFSDKIWLLLKGLAMGAANKVPGVSGGVVAFVAGFYEEFIYSLQKINRKAFKLIIDGRYRSFYRYINGQFLGVLILGMLISYFSVSQLLDYLIIHYELFVWSSFFGMIIGSIYYIAKDFDEWSKRNIAILLCGIIAGVSISFLEPATENDNLLYDTMAELILFDFSFVKNTERLRLLKVLFSFSLGSLAGLVTLSHLLGYLLKHFKSATYAGIIGFIAGSLGVVWPWKEKIVAKDTFGNTLYDAQGDEILTNYKRFIPNSIDLETIIAIFFIFVGILIVLALGWYGEKTKKTK